jgi:hypothetical protein
MGHPQVLLLRSVSERDPRAQAEMPVPQELEQRRKAA